MMPLMLVAVGWRRLRGVWRTCIWRTIMLGALLRAFSCCAAAHFAMPRLLGRLGAVRGALAWTGRAVLIHHAAHHGMATHHGSMVRAAGGGAEQKDEHCAKSEQFHGAPLFQRVVQLCLTRQWALALKPNASYWFGQRTASASFAANPGAPAAACVSSRGKEAS
jgi:hypothetical protein